MDVLHPKLPVDSSLRGGNLRRKQADLYLLKTCICQHYRQLDNLKSLA